MNCTFNITDANAGDTLGANITWWKNNVSTINITLTSLTNGANTTTQLQKANITRGETWKCSVIPYDGTIYGNMQNSSEIVVINTQPITNLLTPSANNISTYRYMNFTWSVEDPDNQSETYTYDYNLTCNSGCSADNRLLNNLAQTNYTSAGGKYLRYLSDEGYSYNWTVRTSDGATNGSYATPRKLEVQSIISISLGNSALVFGSMSPNERKNTTDGSIGPFNISNDGNVYVNVTINASNIWVRQANPSSYYQFKTSNSTNEPGAFSWEKSNISWSYMPSITAMAIANFNWTDAKDEASIDVHLTVPSDEPAGGKTSNITLEASYADEADG